MNEFGHLNCIHFIDLNKGEQPHHLKYTTYVKRAEEAERKIKYDFKILLSTPFILNLKF